MARPPGLRARAVDVAVPPWAYPAPSPAERCAPRFPVPHERYRQGWRRDV